MKNYRFLSFLLLSLTLLFLYACSTTEYAVQELPKLHLAIEVNTEAKLLVNTSREAVIHDPEGAVIQITKLDRMQYDDKTIGKLILTTAQEQGLPLTALKVTRLNAKGVSGVYVQGTKGDSLILVGGFIGLQSIDGYLSVFHFPRTMEEEAQRSMRSIFHKN